MAGLRVDQAPPLDIPLRFFLTAPLFGMAAGVWIAARGALVLAHPLVPETLALVHLVTLGWATMVMVGALYQILPVLVGAPVPRATWGRWVHAGLTLGTAALAAGLATGWPWALAAAAALLSLSLLCALVQCSWAAWGTAGTPAAGWSIRMALVALGVVAAIGTVFALRQAAAAPLGQRTAWITVHAYWGLAGWIGTLILGVSPAVLPMFYLAPEMPNRLLRFALGAAIGTPVLATARLLPGGSALGPWLPALSGLAAYAALALGLERMLRRRRRTATDASLWLWRAALAGGAFACGMLVWNLAAPGPNLLLAFGSAYLVGFAGLIINAMLLKIVPFLVWLHRFSRQAGTAPVPLMGDLLSARHARRQAACMVGAAGALVLAGLLAEDGIARIAGAALIVACGYLEWLLVRAWLTAAPAAKATAIASPGAAARVS